MITNMDNARRFPSPYGVIFILIVIDSDRQYYEAKHSFRLLMELYSFLLIELPDDLKAKWGQVSVSLWSYIHSYG